MLVASGVEAPRQIAAYGSRRGIRAPSALDAPRDAAEALAWMPLEESAPCRFVVRASEAERRQTRRRSIEAALPEAESFYFRGPEGKLNLRAQSLPLFLQMAIGVDDETWLFHLHRGDYSRWLRDGLDEPALAEQVAAVEAAGGTDAVGSRAQVRAILERFAASAQRDSAAVAH